MAKQQQYNIQFPFVNDEEVGAMFKVAPTDMERIRSDIRHVMFTPKGQRYMDPGFGTDLIRYVFDPNDNITWDLVRDEIGQTVKKYVPGVNIKSIEISKDAATMTDTYVTVVYTVTDGTFTASDSFTTKL